MDSNRSQYISNIVMGVEVPVEKQNPKILTLLERSHLNIYRLQMGIGLWVLKTQ